MLLGNFECARLIVGKRLRNHSALCSVVKQPIFYSEKQTGNEQQKFRFSLNRNFFVVMNSVYGSNFYI
jgi:hypothetical protein